MQKILLPLIALASFLPARGDTDAGLAGLVNPFIGTSNGGNTYPGAQAPFGMVQLSPTLRGNGYYYNQPRMHGFTVNLETGSGADNGGTVLFTATTGPVLTDTTAHDYTFDHRDESASAGYYQVRLQPWNVNAELTATTHCGLAQFTFPAGKQANILLPLSIANTPTDASRVEWADDHTLTGFVTSEVLANAGPCTVHFVMRFSRSFSSYGSWSNGHKSDGSKSADQTARDADTGYYVSYPATPKPQEIRVSLGISYVSAAGARANLEAELPDDNFTRVHDLATAAWNKELGLIQVQDNSVPHQRVFYTALYHCMLYPMIFDDVDGSYPGYDSKAHHVPAGHRHFYTSYSGWDIYRSEIPLLAIIEPDRAQDMAQSIVESYKQLGYIDRRLTLNRPAAAMNGEPMTLCLANIWNAGLHRFDMTTAYDGMLKMATPTEIHAHLGPYENSERAGSPWLNADSNVSTSLEYDLAFAALGRLALNLGKPDDANFLLGRALEYRTLYNPATGYLQPRAINGAWDRATETGLPEPGRGKWESAPGGDIGQDEDAAYCEAGKEQYLWFVSHDIQGLVDLLGGPKTFDARLDKFFQSDLYDPTNEPDMQCPYLYDYIDRPWKTQKEVAETANRYFTDDPGGLAGGGNDDLGAMSAWYVFSQLGFYPVDPGVPCFEVTTPRFRRAVVTLAPPHAGKHFVINAPAASAGNVYIQSALLDGHPFNRPYLNETEITSGGEWSVAAGPEPNEAWGSSPMDRPPSVSTDGPWHGYPANPIVQTILPTGEAAAVTWSYATRDPGPDWFAPGFDDSRWITGAAPFGGRHRGAVPRTAWATPDIWLRRKFTMPAGDFPLPAFTVVHAQAVEIYLNGVKVGAQDGHTLSYVRMPVPWEAWRTLHPGENVIAAHVRSSDHMDARGSKYEHCFDLGLVNLAWPDAEK
jgi:predicted alpha-1,2-mannosidase